MIKRNLYLLLFIVFSFLFLGCLKSSSKTSSLWNDSNTTVSQSFFIEQVGNTCTYVYPIFIYKENLKFISHYCLTKCDNGCPDENSNIYEQRNYISNTLCPLTVKNTKYINKTLPRFNDYVTTKSESLVKLSRAKDTLEGQIKQYGIDGTGLLNISSSNIIENDTNIMTICSREQVEKTNDPDESLLKDIIQNYRIVKCNGEKVGIAHIEKSGQIKFIWHVVKLLGYKKWTNYSETQKYVAHDNGILPTETDCSKELIAILNKFLNSTISTFWLSTPATPNQQKTCRSNGQISASHISDVKFDTIVYKKRYNTNECNYTTEYLQYEDNNIPHIEENN